MVYFGTIPHLHQLKKTWGVEPAADQVDLHLFCHSTFSEEVWIDSVLFG